jgi:hypothetical protein
MLTLKLRTPSKMTQRGGPKKKPEKLKNGPRSKLVWFG